jgi:hypothetical protein
LYKKQKPYFIVKILKIFQNEINRFIYLKIETDNIFCSLKFFKCPGKSQSVSLIKT